MAMAVAVAVAVAVNELVGGWVYWCTRGLQRSNRLPPLNF